MDLDGPERIAVRGAQDALHGGPNATADRRFELADLANLGSPGMAGEDLVTMDWGVRVRFNHGV